MDREKMLAAIQAEYVDVARAPVVEEPKGPVVEDGMVLVPSGPFLSGPGKTQRETKAFWIDLPPVTNGDYKRFCEVTGVYFTCRLGSLTSFFTASTTFICRSWE